MVQIIGKNSFVGNYYLNKYENEKIEDVCLLTNKLEGVSFKNTNAIIHLSALVHQMKGAPENIKRLILLAITFKTKFNHNR